MRSWWLAGCFGASVAVGCAGTSGGSSSGTADAGDDAAGDDGGDAGVDKLTWTYIYTTYFGHGSPGACGLAGCHGTPQRGFVCANQAGCYASLATSNPNVGGKMINPQNPAASVLIDPNNSPVVWFSTTGNMPQGNLRANATAKEEITAWIMAGAPND